MPDRRVPRGSKVIDTPGSAGSIAPLDGIRRSPKAMPHNPQTNPHEVPSEESIREEDCSTTEGGRRLGMSEEFISLSYEDVLDLVSGEHVLNDLIDFLRGQEEYLYNPPTPAEFRTMLTFAIRREEGKISEEEVPTAEVRAAARVNPSPKSKKEYADVEHKAFPVDSRERAISAHSYIHKYWNAPSKRGVTAAYGKDDFVRIHKKIMAAMSAFGVEHRYLDGLDDASGVKKEGESTKDSSMCGPEKPNKCDDKPSCDKQECGDGKKVKFAFDYYEGQKVVSFARNRMSEIGTVKHLDNLTAIVQWEDGMETTEFLARLVPFI